MPYLHVNATPSPFQPNDIATFQLKKKLFSKQNMYMTIQPNTPHGLSSTSFRKTQEIHLFFCTVSVVQISVPTFQAKAHGCVPDPNLPTSQFSNNTFKMSTSVQSQSLHKSGTPKICQTLVLVLQKDEKW